MLLGHHSGAGRADRHRRAQQEREGPPVSRGGEQGDRSSGAMDRAKPWGDAAVLAEGHERGECEQKREGQRAIAVEQVFTLG